MTCKILTGCALQQLPTLADQSVHCAVTSPPYWGLRDYGMDGQMGLEKSPDEYVATMVAVFREVRRVLRDDGNLYLNLGDSYAANRGYQVRDGKHVDVGNHMGSKVPAGYKAKDLIGIPWMTAFALRADGWYLREEIIWHKPNCMPESVTDRCTRSHEQIFHFIKVSSKTEWWRARDTGDLSQNPDLGEQIEKVGRDGVAYLQKRWQPMDYFYDAKAIKNPPSPDLLKQIAEGYSGTATKDFEASGVQDASATKSRIIENARKKIDKQRGHSRRHDGFNDHWDALSRDEQMALGSNKRSVWTVPPSNYKAAHFATFPPDLIRPCILAGCPLGGTVLDPFAGSGTTGQVALSHGRSFVGIELNPAYVKLIEDRMANTQPGFM